MELELRVEIVVARHTEDLHWLFELLAKHKESRQSRQSRQSMHATVYNDGPTITVPSAVAGQVTVKEGDHVPAEPTKYIAYILENWDCLDCLDCLDCIDTSASSKTISRIVFLQGDPLYHNPTLPACFDATSQWATDHQNLSLYGHPPPWGSGAAKAILDGRAPGITRFGAGGMVWQDMMGPDMRGTYFKDPFIDDLARRLPNVDMEYLLTLFNRPHPPSGTMKKCYAACFATTPARIKQIPLETWRSIDRFLKEGCQRTVHATHKERAILMEYLWAPLLVTVH